MEELMMIALNKNAIIQTTHTHTHTPTSR